MKKPCRLFQAIGTHKVGHLNYSEMDSFIIFLTVSIPLILISWRTLFNLKSHGFYRFISWECIAWLFASNYENWFAHPFSTQQIISWTLLFISAFLLLHGVVLLKKTGKPKKDRNEKTLYQIEQTTQLIDKGIYKYIRHPLYSSLLFLSWGILFKQLTLGLLIAAVLSTVCLYLTTIFEEKECIIFFGEKYINYMKKSKRFIPYLF